jgi:5-methylcytosine-specific restriction endonuclease McrA
LSTRGKRVKMQAWRDFQWRQDPACDYCAQPIPKGEASIDHINPIGHPTPELRGRNNVRNFAPACLRCNRKKGNRTPIEANMKLRARRRCTPACVKYMTERLNADKAARRKAVRP